MPNPGSDEAIKQGCTCPVLDNGRGRGRYGFGAGPLYWIAFECPLHDPPTPVHTTDEEEA
jgi:hypothetical protein